MKKKFIIVSGLLLVLVFSGVANATYLLDLIKSTGLLAKAALLPESGTILLMGIGLVGLAGYGRRKLINQ